jgi:hypothetical protein
MPAIALRVGVVAFYTSCESGEKLKAEVLETGVRVRHAEIGSPGKFVGLLCKGLSAPALQQWCCPLSLQSQIWLVSYNPNEESFSKALSDLDYNSFYLA